MTTFKLKQFNKEFPCNRSNVNVGDLVWVTEHVKGDSYYSLGKVIETTDSGAEVELKTFSKIVTQFTFGIYGTRHHSRFGSVFQLHPATTDNDTIFTGRLKRQKEKEQLNASARKRALEKMDLIRSKCRSHEEWVKIAEVLDQIEL